MRPKVCGHPTIKPIWACWKSHPNTLGNYMNLPSFTASTLLGSFSDFGGYLWESVLSRAMLSTDSDVSPWFSLLHHSVQLDLRFPVAGVLLVSTKPRFILPDSDSSFRRRRFRCSRVECRCFTPLQPTLSAVHRDLRLVCICSAMKAFHEASEAQSFCWCCFQRQCGALY